MKLFKYLFNQFFLKKMQYADLFYDFREKKANIFFPKTAFFTYTFDLHAAYYEFEIESKKKSRNRFYGFYVIMYRLLLINIVAVLCTV